jgi:ethanolamine utilization protein EutQ (cupin superfamily)
MNERTVEKLDFDPARITPLGPAHTEDRYETSRLSALGPAFMVFDHAGSTERWTLGYEEVVYVVSGELTLSVFAGAESYHVAGSSGDVITIGKGSTVEYAGTAGTRLFVCFAPLNWRDLIETVRD